MRKLLGTFFGIGRLPGPSGTYTSAVTAVLTLAAWYLGCPWWGIAIAAAVVIAVGIVAGHNPEKHFGSKDPHPFVLDEVAGMLIAGFAAWIPQMLESLRGEDVQGMPIAGLAARIPPCYHYPWLILGIALCWFRVADILKPPPAKQLESLPGGWGIVLDDVAAGLIALILTVGCAELLNPLIG